MYTDCSHHTCSKAAPLWENIMISLSVFTWCVLFLRGQAQAGPSATNNETTSSRPEDMVNITIDAGKEFTLTEWPSWSQAASIGNKTIIGPALISLEDSLNVNDRYIYLLFGDYAGYEAKAYRAKVCIRINRCRSGV